MRKIILIFLAFLLVGTITAGITMISLSKDVTFEKEIRDSLENIGIGKFEVRDNENKLLGYNQPIVSECKVIDEYSCEFSIYQEKGINKELEVITKYCDEYEIEFYDGECIKWTDENQTECLEYEILNRTTDECKKWKFLTNKEIETKIENKTKELLTKIAEINIARNTPEIEIKIGEEYKIEIK